MAEREGGAWRDKVLPFGVRRAQHSAVRIGWLRLRTHEGCALFIESADLAHASQLFAQLSSGGHVSVPFKKPFWGDPLREFHRSVRCAVGHQRRHVIGSSGRRVQSLGQLLELAAQGALLPLRTAAACRKSHQPPPAPCASSALPESVRKISTTRSSTSLRRRSTMPRFSSRFNSGVKVAESKNRRSPEARPRERRLPPKREQHQVLVGTSRPAPRAAADRPRSSRADAACSAKHSWLSSRRSSLIAVPRAALTRRAAARPECCLGSRSNTGTPWCAASTRACACSRARSGTATTSSTASVKAAPAGPIEPGPSRSPAPK